MRQNTSVEATVKQICSREGSIVLQDRWTVHKYAGSDHVWKVSPGSQGGAYNVPVLMAAGRFYS